MAKRTLLLCLGICSLAIAAVDNEFLIQNYRVGRISATMSPDEASKQYPTQRVKRWEPYPRVAVIDIDPTGIPDKPAAIRMHLDRDQKRIWMITISDKRYKTSKGIAIGSTFGALRKAHPDLVIGTQEGEMDRFIVAEIKAEGISFLLLYDDTTWAKMQSQPNSHDVPISIIPDEKVIQSISIVPKVPTAPDLE